MFRENKSLTYLYIISHIGIFFISDAIFWDDWVIYHADNDEIFDIFSQAGSFIPITPYLHTYLLPFGPWIYRLLTFVLFFVIIHCFDRIIFNSKLVNSETRYLLVLFFTVLPFNIARVALIIFPSTVCLTLFFIAWRYKHVRLIALPLFFISFATNSLPFFYIIVMAHFFYDEKKSNQAKELFKFVLKKIDYFLLPLVYFSLKHTYFTPNGIYSNYNNHFSFVNLFFTPIRQIFNSGYFILQHEANLVTLSILIFCVSLILPNLEGKVRLPLKKVKVFFFGITCCLIVLFPYWILGLLPTFTKWTSRHQLLMPFGISIIFTTIYCLFNKSYQRTFLVVITSMAIYINASNYTMLFRDWNKQKSLALEIENTKIDLRNKVFFITDNSFKAWNRVYRNYEWNGILNYNSEKPNTVFLDGSSIKAYRSGQLVAPFVNINMAKEHDWTEAVLEIEEIKAADIQKLDYQNLGFIVFTLESILNKIEKLKLYFYPEVVLEKRGIEDSFD